MPPKGSKKAIPAAMKEPPAIKKAAAKKASPPVKKSAAVKKAAAKKAPSPVKKPAAVKKVTKTAAVKKASVKKSPASQETAVNKASSPARPTPSPSKKQAVYKSAMTRAIRASSEMGIGSSRHAKTVFQKRGVLGTDDNDDDPLEPTDEMLAAIGVTSFTFADHMLIEGIRVMETEGDVLARHRGQIIYNREVAAARAGGLDCHTKIYWRYNDMFARKYGGYMHELFGTSSPVKPAGRAASQSPSKPRSPSKAPLAHQESSSSRRSPERRQQATSRPLRREPSSSPEPSAAIHGVAGPSRNVGSSGRIVRTTPAASARSSRLQTDTSTAERNRRRIRDRQTSNYLKAYENAAYRMALAEKSLPAKPRNFPHVEDTITNDDFYSAQQRGVERAETVLAGAVPREDLGVSESEQEAAVEIAAPKSRKPSIQKPRSPVKQSAESKTSTSVTKATPKEPGRGTCLSSQNPEFVEIERDGKTTSQSNPFFETMPAPEVWHRRMPPVFPFGETPYMEKVVSDQINADLSRNHAADDKQSAQDGGVLSRISSSLGNNLGSVIKAALSPSKATTKISTLPAASPWALPEADELQTERFKEAARLYKKSAGSPGKRSADVMPPSPQKRQRSARGDERQLY